MAELLLQHVVGGIGIVLIVAGALLLRVGGRPRPVPTFPVWFPDGRVGATDEPADRQP